MAVKFCLTQATSLSEEVNCPTVLDLAISIHGFDISTHLFAISTLFFAITTQGPYLHKSCAYNENKDQST
jgi:hypothetical protein